MDTKNIVALGVAIAERNGKSLRDVYEYEGETCEYSKMISTFTKEIQNVLGSSYNQIQKNKYDAYEIMTEVLNEVLPTRVIDRYADWCEMKQVKNGEKARFAARTGKQRAKQFITRVGLAGVYEVCKLDKEFFEVETTAYGGAAQIGIEEMMDGVVDMGEILTIMLEGLDDAIMREIAKALKGMVNQLPGVNKHTHAGFDETSFDRLIATTRAYGTPVIYTTQQFASKLLPNSALYSEDLKKTYCNQGYVGNYKGTKIVLLPQSFEPWDSRDDVNKNFVFDPQVAYIIPSGSANEKPVKMVMEGSTLITDRDNYDWSKDIHFYKKFGVALRVTDDICAYTDSTIPATNVG